jgi:ATP synthase F subunit
MFVVLSCRGIPWVQQLTRPGQIADRIRHRVDTYTAAFPALLEIPSKDHPYDPEKDSVLRRVRRLFGE